MSWLTIQLEGNSSEEFVITFASAFLLLLIIFLIDGLRRHNSFFTLSLVLLSLIVFFFVGMKIGAAGSISETGNFLIHPPSQPLAGKNGAMGMFFAIPFLLLALYWLRLPLRLLDPFAFAFPIATIIQRIGCLWYGCCHGCPTQLPMAVQYGQNSPAWNYHLSQGWIDESAHLSIAVHPVPFYYIISGLITIIILVIMRKKVKAGGNLVLLSLLSLISCRFFIEFFREGYTNGFSGQPFAGIKQLQWFFLLLLIIGFITFYFRENSTQKSINLAVKPSLYRSVIWYAGSLLLIYHLHNAFTPVEKGILLLFFCLTGYQLFIHITRRLIQLRLKYLYLSLASIFFIAIGQSPEEAPTKPKRSIIEKFTTLDLNAGWGNLDYTYYVGGTEGCMGDPGTPMRSQSSFTGIGISTNFHTLYKGDRRNVWMLQGYFMPGQEILNGNNESVFFYSLSGGGRYHWRNVGLGYGITAGQAQTDEGVTFGGMPYLTLRLGPQRICYLDAGVGDFTLNPFPLSTPTVNLGIGSHFGRTDDAGLRLGFYQKGHYGLAHIPVSRNLTFNFQYHYFPVDIIDDAKFYKVGLTYRFSDKKKR
ncbi:hypothetical protein DMA11_21370 [Marinilabiliaceae bacterium JC017]|nr:hypothetical protein DMA11_21370 [Marinilabiliaceae bacterium JC017]